MLKNVIIFGPPNSGKGTQAEKLAQKLKADHFGAGDAIREETERQTPLGKKFEEYTSQGTLIPSDLLNQVFTQKIEQIKESKIVFDGFPRNLEQAEFLERLLSGQEFLGVNIQVSAESLLERMAKRRICSGCDKIFIVTDPTGQTKCDECGGKLIKRDDDKPEILKNRLQVYEQETLPVIDYYRKHHKVINIDGEPPIEEVEKAIWEAVNE